MVSREQVAEVAKLAKLRLSEEEATRVAGQLAGILDYVEMLREVDDVEIEAAAGDESPTVGPRADEPAPSLPRDAVLGLAPKADEETFLVPPVIDGGGGA